MEKLQEHSDAGQKKKKEQFDIPPAIRVIYKYATLSTRINLS